MILDWIGWIYPAFYKLLLTASFTCIAHGAIYLGLSASRVNFYCEARCHVKLPHSDSGRGRFRGPEKGRMFNTPGTDSFSPLFISGHEATHGALLIFYILCPRSSIPCLQRKIRRATEQIGPIFCRRKARKSLFVFRQPEWNLFWSVYVSYRLFPKRGGCICYPVATLFQNSFRWDPFGILQTGC